MDGYWTHKESLIGYLYPDFEADYRIFGRTFRYVEGVE
jgi:hypothetical protein